MDPVQPEDDRKSQRPSPSPEPHEPQSASAHTANGSGPGPPSGAPVDEGFHRNGEHPPRPSEDKEESAGQGVLINGTSPTDDAADRKRKRGAQGQAEQAVSAEAVEEANAGETRPDGAERYSNVLVDNTTRKRLKVVSYQEYRNRNGGIKPTRTNRSRIPVDRSELPSNVWQRIFVLCAPGTLVRLSRTNKKFHGMLVPLSEPGSHPPPSGLDEPSSDVDPESIWVASRQLFYPDLPKPLQGWSELQMWRLVAARPCQFCGKPADDSDSAQAEYPGARKLGDGGVAVIWAFGQRSCGTCLVKNAEKEIDVVISSAIPSALLAAIPPVFLTQRKNIITTTSLQVGSPPPTVQIIKYFSKKDIEGIRIRFEEVKQLGAAATEEWFKGLSAEGNRRSSDAARWERWESHGGLSDVLSALQQLDHLASPQHHSPKTASHPIVMGDRSGSRSHSASEEDGAMARRHKKLPGPQRLTHNPSSPHSASVGSQNPLRRTEASNHVQQSRVERTVHQVNELKAARRQAIEQRCAELDPPIESNVLGHMESFQNALLISTPLTENAWQVLKPRLLAQREAAEKKEADRVATTRQLQAKVEQRRHNDAQAKEEKEALDREWDEAQAPIREILGQYADKIIEDKWSGGRTLTNETSPKFAADVLIYVRHQFYQRITNEDSQARREGREIPKDSPQAPPTRRLILENMKWVFDTKIKRFTEQFRKELFLCHICDNSKFYGFEGVVQHFAAKHTNTLSQGAVVVHWRAEWPDYPPFHPDPSAVKTAMFSVPGHVHAGGPVHSGYGHTRYPPSPAPHGHHGFPHYSPSPYPPIHYPQGYQGPQQHGPFAPPPPPSAYQGAPVFPGSQPHGYHHPDHAIDYAGGQQTFSGPPPPFRGPPAGYPAAAAGGGRGGGGSGFQGQPSQGPPNPYGPPYAGYPAPPPEAGGPGPQNFGPASSSYNHLSGHGPSQHPAEHHPPLGVSTTGGSMYKTQLDFLASAARELWFSISGVKDLPSSVRIFVVIYHAAIRYKERFSIEPTLAMFLDALINHMAMKPVKHVNGLVCKACNASNGPGMSHHHQTYGGGPAVGERRLYALSTLLGHFQTVHVDRARSYSVLQNGTTVPRLHWKVDMLELPERAVISGLVDAVGMDDQKLRLIADAFPEVFPWPLPVVGRASNSGPVPISRDVGPSPRNAGAPRWNQPDSRLAEPSLEPRGGHTYLTTDYAEATRSARNTPSQVMSRPYRASGTNSRGVTEWEPPEKESGPPHHGRGHPRYRPEHHGPEFDGPRRSPGYHRSSLHVVVADENDARDTNGAGVVRDRYSSSGDPRHGADERGGSSRQHANRHGMRHVEPYEAARDHESKAREPLGFEPAQKRAMGQQEPGSAARNSGSSLSRRLLLDAKPRTAEGSEDGEVGPAAEQNEPETRAPASVEGLSAAERFLNEFLPGDGADAPNPKPGDMRVEGTMSRRPGSPEAHGHARSVRSLDSEGDRDGGDAAVVAAVRRSPREPSVSLVRPEAGDFDPAVSSSRGPRQLPLRDYRAEGYPRSPSRLGEAYESQGAAPPRYASNTVMYHDERHTADSVRRPRSRYERYATVARDGSHARSRSPPRHYPPGAEHVHYRTSPTTVDSRYQPSYRARSPMPMFEERYPSDAASRYPSGSHVTHYRSYADDPRGYAPSYAVPMEYVPVRRVSARSPPPGAVVIESPSQMGAYARYPQYEDEYPRPEYESRAPVYRVDRAIYHDEVSRRPPHHPGY